LVGRQQRPQLSEQVGLLRDRLDLAEVAVVKLERLHRKALASGGFDAAAPSAIGQLVAGDREQPADRLLRQLSLPVEHGAQSDGERLGEQVGAELRAIDASREEGEHERPPATVEEAEGGPVARACRRKQLAVIGLVLAHEHLDEYRRRVVTTTGVSWRLLIAAQPFSERLDGPRVAAAIAEGVVEAGLPAPDLCPLADDERDQDSATLLGAADFDARMKASRAVVLAIYRLDEHTLLGSLCFEIATRARQSGVPAYAITSKDAIDRFDARILDLQVVLEARSARSLRTAGRQLAEIV
jgi:hypothetical protein